ncbi:MAG TPA: tetratricopeptide repeat protein [Bryobacteraceae bacterium]|nr:tetratricopeptide repeat protein [Bryobacteraceae bacterium]
MKVIRLASILCFCTSFSFGASKEVVELQRDVAILQDQVRTVQRTLDEKLAQLTLLMQQTQENSSKANNSLSGIQSAVSDTLSQQLQPVTHLGSKVDGLSEDVHGLRDTVNDLSSRLAKLDAKVTDLGNRLSIMQNPPSAPGAPGATGAPGASTPPPGMTAESAWQNAEKDRLGGNTDLALKEYQDYITYFPNTDYAPNAQFEIGEIYYNKQDYPNALKAFDTLLERFPDNPRTRSAHFMKGQTLLHTGDKDGAVQEFKYIVANYPGTEDSRRSVTILRGLGIRASSKPSPARRR